MMRPYHILIILFFSIIISISSVNAQVNIGQTPGDVSGVVVEKPSSESISNTSNFSELDPHWSGNLSSGVDSDINFNGLVNITSGYAKGLMFGNSFMRIFSGLNGYADALVFDSLLHDFIFESFAGVAYFDTEGVEVDEYLLIYGGNSQSNPPNLTFVDNAGLNRSHLNYSGEDSFQFSDSLNVFNNLTKNFVEVATLNDISSLGSNGVSTDGTGSLNELTYWLNSTTVAADSGVIIQPSTNGLSFNVLNGIQDIFIDDTQGYLEWNQVVKDNGFNTFEFQQEAWIPDFDTISQNTNNNNFLYKLQDEIYCAGLHGYIGSQTGWNATQTIGGATSLLSDDDIRELFCHTGGDWETKTQAFNITIEGTSTLPVRSDKEWWLGVSFRNSPATSLPDNLIMEFKNSTGGWTVLVDTTPTAGQAHYIKQFDSSPSPNHILGLRWQFGDPQSSDIFLDELYILHGAAWAEEFGKRGFDNVWHGTNTFLTNITMASPDGNLWTCGVDNSGSFSCS